MTKITSTLVAMGFVLAGCTAIEDPSANSEMMVADDGTEVECRRIKEMGTMLGKRVCMEPAEWQEVDRAAEEGAEDFMGSSRGAGQGPDSPGL